MSVDPNQIIWEDEENEIEKILMKDFCRLRDIAKSDTNGMVALGDVFLKMKFKGHLFYEPFINGFYISSEWMGLLGEECRDPFERSQKLALELYSEAANQNNVFAIVRISELLISNESRRKNNQSLLPDVEKFAKKCNITIDKAYTTINEFYDFDANPNPALYTPSSLLKISKDPLKLPNNSIVYVMGTYSTHKFILDKVIEVHFVHNQEIYRGYLSDMDTELKIKVPGEIDIELNNYQEIRICAFLNRNGSEPELNVISLFDKLNY